MDLHRPPCSALRANEIYYLIAALAYNLMAAVKLVDLNDDCQGWRVQTLMKKLVFLPGRLTRKARQWVAKVLVPGGWLKLVATLATKRVAAGTQSGPTALECGQRLKPPASRHHSKRPHCRTWPTAKQRRDLHR